MSKPATPSQVSYLQHLLKQVGADEPDWDKLSVVDAGALIADLKAKRGRPVWYGNGQFSHWEKQAMAGAAPLSLEKLNELLLKVRKNATASFGWRQIIAVVQHLGGSVESGLGFSKPFDRTQMFKDEAEAEKFAEELRRKIKPLPANPKKGDIYVESVDVRPAYGMRESDPQHSHTGVDWMQVVVVPVNRVELAGHAENFSAEAIYEVLSWLKHTAGWDKLAASALGVEEHMSPSERVREGLVGTCGVCFKVYKMRAKGSGLPVMVVHGYQRPGWGNVVNECLGWGYPPYELSDKATRKAVQTNEDYIASRKKALHDLESGVVQEINKAWYGRPGSKMVTPADEGWAYAVQEYGARLKSDIKAVERNNKVLESLINRWEPRELPVAGQRLVNWLKGACGMADRVAARYLEVIR